MLILLGEHDKGLGEPFSEKTISGKRLRKLFANPFIGSDWELDNAFDFKDGQRVEKDLSYLKKYTVMALGREAEKECIRQGVSCHYLPHPACRSKKLLSELARALAEIRAEW